MNEASVHATQERFFPNTIALGAYTIVGTLLTLLQVKLLSVYLSKEAFGMFASLRGLCLLLALLSANGFPALLVRFLPVHESRSDRNQALVLWLGTTALALAILLICAFVTIARRGEILAFLPPEMLEGALLFWFFVLAFGLTLKLLVYGGLNGVRRLVHQALLETGSLSAALVWICVEGEALDLESLFKILGVVSLVASLLGVPMLARFVSFKSAEPGPPIDRPGKGADSTGVNGEYFHYWLGALGLSLVAIAFSDFDRYLASQVLALDLLAVFHIGSRLLRVSNRLLGVPNIAFQPEITRLHAQGKQERVILAFNLMMKVNLAVAVLAAISLAILSRELVLLVANERYLQAVPLVVLFAFSIPLSTAAAPITTAMKALDQVRAALYCDLIWAALYLSLLFPLGAAYGIMGMGVAHLSACMAQLLLSLRLSNLEVSIVWVTELGGTLLMRAVPVFIPVLILEFAGGDLPRWVFYPGKIVLFASACAAYLYAIRKKPLFTIDERSEVKRVLYKRRLGFLADVIL